jgi:transposase
MPKQYPIEFRQRGLRLVLEAGEQAQYETEWAAIVAVSSRLGVNSETLRKWLRRSEIDAGTRPGVTSEEQAEIRRLKKENAELRRANEILRTASAFFAAELDRPAPR